VGSVLRRIRNGRPYVNVERARRAVKARNLRAKADAAEAAAKRARELAEQLEAG
jgi:hypothetical protein